MTAILTITSETGPLPSALGPLARYISGKSGGLGEIISSLSEGLVEMLPAGVNTYIALPNLKKRFRKFSGMDEHQWRTMRYGVDYDKVKLANSPSFAELDSIYEGDQMRSARDFQEQLVNSIIKDVSSKGKGELVVHTHDWMAGGIVSAYLKKRKIPFLHTIHNLHTNLIPVEMFDRVDLGDFWENLYIVYRDGKEYIDCQATAAKNASLVNCVGGGTFLEELVAGKFRDIAPDSIPLENEVRIKRDLGLALAIPNAPPESMYPERNEHLVEKFSPEDDIISAKRENLLEYQRRTGLKQNPNAILYFWPSRLDGCQKGAWLLEEVIQKFIEDDKNIQIAIIGDDVKGQKQYSQTLGPIAHASKGRIVCYPFRPDFCELAYGAANDVFGASRYEPWKNTITIGNLNGSTATDRDTGGCHDQIVDGVNGFLFKNEDVEGLRYGLRRSLEFHQQPAEVRQPLLREIMLEARRKYSRENMTKMYIEAYKRIAETSGIKFEA